MITVEQQIAMLESNPVFLQREFREAILSALRQQSRLREALYLATDFIREEGVMGSLSDEKWRALIVDRLQSVLAEVPQK